MDFEVTAEDGVNERLDRYLQRKVADMSRSRLQDLIKDGHVLLNTRPALKPSYELRAGDRLVLVVPPPVDVSVQAQDIPLDVLFEDEHIVVINKASGLVVHPAAGNPDGTLVNALLFVAATMLFLPRNPWPLILALPVLGWLLGYSYAKRFTSLAHLWLGASLAMAPVAAWIAIQGQIAWAPAFLGLAVLTWVTGFDIIYACQDEAFDRSAGLNSIPARLGANRALKLAAGFHLLTIVFLGLVGWTFPLGRIYGTGVGLAALLLAVEHWLVKPDDLRHVNVAFFNVNIILSIGILTFAALDLIF